MASYELYKLSAHGIHFDFKQTVTQVDPLSKTVTLESKESFPYDKLILAPGGIPRRLPVEGAELGNVLTLRHVEDAKKIDEGG